MNEPDLELKILRLLDGELPAEELGALEARLLEDAGAMETYLLLVQIHNGLETRFAATSTVEEMAAVPVERIIPLKQRRWVKASLLAAAVLVMTAVILRLVTVTDLPVSLGVFQTTPDSRFVQIHQDDGEAPEGNHLVEGSRLRLADGAMEVTLASGVRMVAVAPCDFQLLKMDRIALENGVAWFQVPPNATGFVVETSQLTIVDLGTEFGVVATSAGVDEIHVTKGSVNAKARQPRGGERNLSAGQGGRMDQAGRLRKITAVPSKFLTSFKRIHTVEIVNHSFEADVLPRDGDKATSLTGSDDYNKDLVPSGWTGFDDGDGPSQGVRGILSTAPDSYFAETLAATPDNDENDQVFYSATSDIFQILTERLQPDSTYTLTVDIGDRADRAYLRRNEGNPGNPGFRLGVGTTPGEGLLKPATTHFPTQVDGGWVTWSATYTTEASPSGLGQPLRLELTSGRQVGWFDNVRLTVTR